MTTHVQINLIKTIHNQNSTILQGTNILSNLRKRKIMFKSVSGTVFVWSPEDILQACFDTHTHTPKITISQTIHEYGISTHTWLIFYGKTEGKYTSPMDPIWESVHRQKMLLHLFNSFFAIFAHVIILLEFRRRRPAHHTGKSNKKKTISSTWNSPYPDGEISRWKRKLTFSISSVI